MPDPAMVDLLNPVPSQRARLLLANGDPTEAQRLTRQRGLRADDQPDYAHERAYLLLARVLMAERAPDQAVALLGRLQDLPVDIVKIDKTFVSMVRTGNERLPILNSMINMAHSLGLTVVAEGVENERQLDFLRRACCDVVQGFLLSKPLAPDEMTAFLLARVAVDAADTDSCRRRAGITGSHLSAETPL